MTPDEFCARARSHLYRLIALSIASYALAAALTWVALWAEDQRAWESAVVYYVFLAAAIAPCFAAFYFAVSIYAWFKDYRRALRDLPMYAQRPDVYSLLHAQVIGPIAWK